MLAQEEFDPQTASRLLPKSCARVSLSVRNVSMAWADGTSPATLAARLAETV